MSDEIKIVSAEEMAEKIMKLNSWPEFNSFLSICATEGLPNWVEHYNDARKDPKVQTHIERLISDRGRAMQQANSAT